MSTASATAPHVSAFSLSAASASSALNPRSHPFHPAHTAHPLREQAFTLHCEGLRSPAIAAELGIPERTIRAWLAADLKELAEERRATRREQLLLAVERQHTLTAAAWQQFETEAAARDAFLAAALAALDSSESPAAARPLHLHLPASTTAPRYLSLILHANKEVNRLLGLYQLAKLELLTPESVPAPLTDPASPAETATTSAESETPAESATAPSGLAAGLQPANLRRPLPSPLAASCRRIPAESEMPAETATTSTVPAHAAETATVVSPLRARRGVGGEVPLPAETATTPSSLQAAYQRRHAPTRPQPSIMECQARVQTSRMDWASARARPCAGH